MQICKSLLEDGVRTHAFPGAVLVVGDDTGILLEVTAGRLSLDPESSAVQPDTIYDVASLTKVVVTTTLAMGLFEEGRLDLDACLPGGFTHPAQAEAIHEALTLERRLRSYPPTQCCRQDYLD